VALHLERRRRRPTRTQLTAAASAGAGLLLLLARRAGRLKGKATETIQQVQSTETAPDSDPTLTDKVRTELFRRPGAPKGAVNVSVVDGVVYLRGEVDSLDEVQRLVDDALSVTGVVGVESLLQTPGTPAPTNGAG
jgi:osmotically-inducible protein OsmY